MQNIMKNSGKRLNEFCQKKWQMSFEEFLKGTINEVESGYLSNKDAIKQIKELVYVDYEEEMKEVLEKLVSITALGERIPDYMVHEAEELLTKLKQQS